MSAPGAGPPPTGPEPAESAESAPDARRRRALVGVLVLLAVLLAVAAVVAVLVARGGAADPAQASCDRTADAPGDGTVASVTQGAQLTVGDVQAGIGGLSADGCAVNVLGDVGWVAVGEQVEVAGVPVVLLGVEPRQGADDEAGGAFEATFWVGAGA